MSDAAGTDLTAEQASGLIASRPYQRLLAIAAVLGVIVSLAAWCFLELTHQIQQEAFVHLPDALGYDNGPPDWWYLVVLFLAGVLCAAAIERLPGRGGHVPVHGLQPGGPADPAELPGVVLAALASIGLGVVVGPEAPLVALGAGLAVWTLRLARRDVEPQASLVVAATGSFAAISFIFGSPVIAAVILMEASGLGGHRMRIILLPGLLGAGIGSLVSIGMGSLTGLSSSAYALGVLPLASFARPTFVDFLWTIPLAIVIAIGAQLIMRFGRASERVLSRRPSHSLPVAGLVIAGLAIGFAEATGKSVFGVLLSGEEALPDLVSKAGTYSLGALALLLLAKGIAYGISLGGFRGGPAFPALFLGAAAGIMASHLPGMALTPAVAIGIAAGFASVLAQPLSAIVLATLLTSKSGAGVEPLIILGTVVSYVVTMAIGNRRAAAAAPAAAPAPA